MLFLYHIIYASDLYQFKVTFLTSNCMKTVLNQCFVTCGLSEVSGSINGVT